MLKPIEPESLQIRLRVAERILRINSQIRQLEKTIPICSHCRRIRRADANYEQLESYVERHSRSSFSHDICPDCMAWQNRLMNPLQVM